MTFDNTFGLSLEDLRIYAKTLQRQLADIESKSGKDGSNNLYIHIYGGLGNQLFQAAFAIMIREAFGGELNLLTVSYRDDDLRSFLLHMFPGIRARIAPAADAIGSAMVQENALRSLPLEDMLSSIAHILSSSKRTYFTGFWQDERYFIHIRDKIREALQPEVSLAVQAKAQKLLESEAIGIHVRRHGYGHMGLARLSYYLEAIADIRRDRGNIPIYCFTDDPSFCRYSFRSIPNFIMADDGNTYNPIVNFAMLASCRHHIIANSSFSWWAAWLNEQSDSIIYAPRPWIIPDLETNPVPQRWRQIFNAIQGP